MHDEEVMYSCVEREGVPKGVLDELIRGSKHCLGRFYECTSVHGWFRIDKATGKLYVREGLNDDA